MQPSEYLRFAYSEPQFGISDQPFQSGARGELRPENLTSKAVNMATLLL
jgi:hypothetical protein